MHGRIPVGIFHRNIQRHQGMPSPGYAEPHPGDKNDRKQGRGHQLQFFPARIAPPAGGHPHVLPQDLFQPAFLSDHLQTGFAGHHHIAAFLGNRNYQGIADLCQTQGGPVPGTVIAWNVVTS